MEEVFINVGMGDQFRSVHDKHAPPHKGRELLMASMYYLRCCPDLQLVIKVIIGSSTILLPVGHNTLIVDPYLSLQVQGYSSRRILVSPLLRCPCLIHIETRNVPYNVRLGLLRPSSWSALVSRNPPLTRGSRQIL